MNKILYLERIRNLREDSDYSQAEVAKILHVAQRPYSDYERGNVRIPLDAMIQLAQLYKVSMDYICCLTDKK